MKIIIIYYGYGNHTKMIAETIQTKLNCDIVRIVPKVPYSKDYQTVVDETEDNLESKKTPEIENININLEEYDKIILGTPVWWYTIAPPIRTFLTKYNLSGKIVIPYATNAGWLGNTFDEIKELCKGNIVNPKSIKFSTDHRENKLVTSNEEINTWINKIKEEK